MNREVFNEIASSWYNFRHHTIFRKELEDMVKRWKQGRLLNAGCGHGADFVPFRDSFELYGVDFSSRMLEMAKKYSSKYNFTARLIEADIRVLPFEDTFFDRAIAVATYHHLLTREEQLTAFRELYRVLKPGGEAFITVWNRWQTRFWFKPKNVRVPWRKKEKTFYRDYYLFTYGELEKLARQAGFQILKIFPEYSYKFPMRSFSRNICLLVTK